MQRRILDIPEDCFARHRNASEQKMRELTSGASIGGLRALQSLIVGSCYRSIWKYSPAGRRGDQGAVADRADRAVKSEAVDSEHGIVRLQDRSRTLKPKSPVT